MRDEAYHGFLWDDPFTNPRVLSAPTVSGVIFQVCFPSENQVMYPSFLRTDSTSTHTIGSVGSIVVVLAVNSRQLQKRLAGLCTL